MRIITCVLLLAVSSCVRVPIQVAQQTAQQSLPLQAQGAFWALIVPDLDASVHWYESMLGLHLLKRSRSPRVAAESAVLEGRNLFVELVHYDARKPGDSPATSGIPPLGVMKAGAIVSAEDFDRLAHHLEVNGVQFLGGVFEDKEMHSRTFLVRDNSGNRIQFFADKK